MFKFRLLSVTFIVVLTVLAASSSFADQKNVDADPSVDFSQFHTFRIGQGKINSKNPNLNSPLVQKRIADAIRAQLAAKGLEEDPQRPDLIVTFHLGSANRREVESWPAGRFGWARAVSVYHFAEGTLVIDLLQRGDREMVWRGIYSDDESDAGKIDKKLPDDVKKLFDKYPAAKK